MSIRVDVRSDESIESAIRRLRRLCSRDGRPRGRRARAFYEKPSDKRRREARERLKTIRRASKMS